jgi:quercetin dioxygenase-like cupin family protein
MPGAPEPASSGDAQLPREESVNTVPVLDLRSIFGVHARISKSGHATDGEFVEMDCTAEPGSGTMVHFHPEQEETFEVLEGELEVLRDSQWTLVPAGESHTVPKGAVHAWRNSAKVPARFVNVHRPALGFEDHMRTLDRLVREGKIRGKSDPRSIIYMSMSAVEHQPDVTVKPPQWLVKLTAAVGRRLGFSLGPTPSRDSAQQTP